VTALRACLLLAAAALLALILWAAATASFGASFAAIASDPWGLVTLADLYLGFLMIAVVIALVERPLPAALWIVAALVLGNVVAAAWLALRLGRIAPELRRAR
jgi:hypothetical protein